MLVSHPRRQYIFNGHGDRWIILGVGKATVKALLEKNATVYMACRNQLKAAEAILELQKQTGKEAMFLQLDLADLKSVKAAAEDFLRQVHNSRHFWLTHVIFNVSSKENILHVLFNNA